jgi:hypothetical protein
MEDSGLTSRDFPNPEEKVFPGWRKEEKRLTVEPLSSARAVGEAEEISLGVMLTVKAESSTLVVFTYPKGVFGSLASVDSEYLEFSGSIMEGIQAVECSETKTFPSSLLKAEEESPSPPSPSSSPSYTSESLSSSSVSLSS